MKTYLLLALALLLASAGFAEEEPGYSDRNDMGGGLPDVVEGDEFCCIGFIVLPALLLISVSARIYRGISR